MDEQLKKICTDGGINYETAMERFFDDEDMYVEFLGKFNAYDTLQQLKAFVAAADVKHAFEAAHTLKGVSANLSLDSVNAVLNPMVEILRAGSMESVAETMPQLETVCEKMAQTIEAACAYWQK